MNEFPERASIQVELFTPKMWPSLVELAREVEGLFGSPMAEDGGFMEFIRRKMAQHEAWAECDRLNSSEILGSIAVSHHNSARS
jgi:hypothetical protein